jgi:sterol 3beta-glucosyltransferase
MRAAAHRAVLLERLFLPRVFLALWSYGVSRDATTAFSNALASPSALSVARCATALIPFALGCVAAFTLFKCSASDASSDVSASEAAWLWPQGQPGEHASQTQLPVPLPTDGRESMRIVIFTIGTRGDVQPFIALAQYLRDTGRHTVVIATTRDFERAVLDAGLEFADLGVPRVEQPPEWLRVTSVGGMIEASAPRMVADYPSVANAFRDAAGGKESARPRADVLIGTAMTLTFTLNVGEAFNIPVWIAKLAPDLMTSAFGPPGSIPSSCGTFNLANTVWYWIRVALAVNRTGISAAEDAFRERLRLGPVRAVPRLEAMSFTPTLLGFSRALCPAPLDWSPWAFQCGFWLNADSGANREDPHLGLVSREVRAFLPVVPSANSAPTACVTLGSMTNASRPTLLGDITRLLRSRGVRVLVVRGWAGGAESDAARGLPAAGSDDGFLAVNEAPHGYVFPKCVFVVHHGGAGTTSRALASGVPSVIVPVLRWSDQMTWGAFTEERGVGVLVREANPSPAVLSAAIERAVSSDCRRAANTLGATLFAERACAPVLALLEGCLCNVVLPPALADVVAAPALLPRRLETLSPEQRMCAKNCVACSRKRRLEREGSHPSRRAQPLSSAPAPRSEARRRRGSGDN